MVEFTGLFYRDEIAAYYRASGLPEPYDETAAPEAVRLLLRDSGSPRSGPGSG